MTPRTKKLLMIAPIAIVGIALFAALGGWIVRELWNWLLPPLFGWPRLTFWQAFAMLALCRILFGGRGFHFGEDSRIRERMQERFEKMTPEQRERFRKSLIGRLSHVPAEEAATDTTAGKE
jgi:hypothetical protein